VRIALGANPAAISRMIVGRGMCYATVGTVIGLGLTSLEARWLKAFLFGVSATDPLTTVAVAAALLLVAAIACWLPGLRVACPSGAGDRGGLTSLEGIDRAHSRSAFPAS
jgi:ABC-type lipoprotein release transport system permease subunit